jgi:peptidoglycan/xylan/chitin deacetylase (PgdA/CDA1 family)
MKIFITLDYELYFGSDTGNPEHCMVRPTEELLKLTDPLGIKFTCFVDSGYLLALEHQKGEYPVLQKDYEMIAKQLRQLSKAGHGIELHIHPHWEDSFFGSRGWEINTHRYKLSAFSESEVLRIVQKHTALLEKITGKPPKAYRAGGWSAQPFQPIGRALENCGVFIDSSVFPGGYYKSDHQEFDFRSVPAYTTEYQFSSGLTIPDSQGKFREIPISSQKVSPFFYWKMAWAKVFGDLDHRSFGNGQPIRLSRGYFDKLTRTSVDVVSMDGYKSNLLKKAFKNHVKHTSNQGNFVIIGHPKAFTRDSLKRFKRFLEETCREHQYCTFQ